MINFQNKFRFQSEAHDRLLERILRRKRFSEQKMQERYARWLHADNQAIAYVPEKLVDQQRKALRDRGEPQYTTMYIPYDYGLASAAHTYLTSVFLGRSPVLQYFARDGRGEGATLALEALADYQVRVGYHLPVLYLWFMDVVKYGLGIVGGYWDEDMISVRRKIQIPKMFMGVATGEYTEEYQQSFIEGYKGEKIWNVRPFDFFPDPRVHIRDIQKGEWCGCYTYVNWNDMIRYGNDEYFNLDVLRDEMSGGGGYGRVDYVAQVNQPYRPGEETFFEREDMRAGCLLNMHVELVPEEWGLAKGRYPEKWVFTVANDRIICGVKPAGDYHNKYPYSVLEYEIDSAPMFKRGVYEQSESMVNTLNWLYNTHFYNTRKSLNDMFVVDPTKVVVKDVEDPEPGKVIRLKAEAYGTDVRSAIWQFQTNNVTQQHLQDGQLVGQLLQRITGVNDNIMGLQSPGGRKTATEVRTSSSFAINRLKTISEWFSCTGFDFYSQLTLQLSQQYYTTQQQLRVAGEAWKNDPMMQQNMVVTPQDIQGFFDFVPVDGTLPVDRYALVNMWGQLMQQMAQVPQVFAQYDIGRIFAWIAQLGGLKNIAHFKVQMMPQGAGAPPGTLPVGAGSNVREIRGSAGANGGTPIPRQIGGSGRSG